MKSNFLMAGLVAVASVTAGKAAETHANFQSVNAEGVSAWAGTTPVQLVGVLLTDPVEMLDSTPHFLPWNGGENQLRMGAEWQVAIQAVGASDRGGTFLYMGQNYGNMPWLRNSDLSYSDAAWSAEIERLNHDPASGRAFRKGDLVLVTANRSAFYGGKLNVNETHDIAPAADFSIELLVADYGLPTPESLSLASLVRPDDADPGTKEDIFDPTRASGGEHWQSMRVRITGLTLTTTDGWDASAAWGARTVKATDGEGRVFTLRHPRYSLGAAPAGKFDAIGVLNQESGSGTDGKFGYELFVQEVAPASEPALKIEQQLAISWPGELINYRLEKASEVPGNWTPVPELPALIGEQNVILQSATNHLNVYRLQRAR